MKFKITAHRQIDVTAHVTTASTPCDFTRKDFTLIKGEFRAGLSRIGAVRWRAKIQMFGQFWKPLTLVLGDQLYACETFTIEADD